MINPYLPSGWKQLTNENCFQFKASSNGYIVDFDKMKVFYIKGDNTYMTNYSIPNGVEIEYKSFTPHKFVQKFINMNVFGIHKPLREVTI